MTVDLIAFLAFGLFIQAAILFAEVVINFKKPILLKIIILIISFAFAWRGVGFLYSYYYGYNRWALEIPQALLPAGAICLFAYIYEHKLKWHIIFFGLSLFVTQLLILLYFRFIDPVNADIPLWSLSGVRGKIAKYLKVFFVIILFSINLRIILKILTKYTPQNIYFKQLRNWTLWILVLQFLSGISFVTSHYFKFDKYNNTAYFILLLFNYILVLLLLFRPKFLNRSNLKIKLGDLFDKKVDGDLSTNLFVEMFFTNLYYLNKDASVEDLKTKLSVSSEMLSNFLYNNYGTGLIDLINKNRINYFIDLVNTGKYGNYTIDALAQEAGFNSRFHLYKSFKKFHGGTPSDFVRSVHD